MEDDLARNYAEDVVVLTGCGIFRGHDGLQHLARLLRIVAQTIHYTVKPPP